MYHSLIDTLQHADDVANLIDALLQSNVYDAEKKKQKKKNGT